MLSALKFVEIIGEDEISNLDPETIYFIVNILNKNSNTKGKNNIRHLYSWTKDNIIIKCFGWYDGTHDCINKHELIPYGSSKFLEDDSSTILLYGDIYLLKCNNQ